MIRTLSLFLGSCLSLSAQTVRQTTEARLWLQTPAGQNPCSAKHVQEFPDLARDWSTRFGRPVHLGEFGSHKIGDHESRTRYARDVRTLAETRGIPWTLWDWKAGFCYWDADSNRPLLRNALFD